MSPASPAAREAPQYARSLIEASLDPLVTISPDGKITDVNEATVKVTGVRRQQLVGTDFASYFTDPEKARDGYRQVFARGAVADYPLTIRSSDGRLTDVLYNASVYKDANGVVLGVFAAARDVTAQKQASQYARSLIEASLDPLVTISPGGKITDVNDATVRITGRKRDELIGTDFASYFTEPERARAGYEEVFAKGSVTDYPLTIHGNNGNLVDVLYNATVYKDARGQVLGVFAAARDVTAQKQASQYARSLIEASLDPLVTISPDGKITDVNEATAKITGVPRERLIGTDFADYFLEPEKAREGYKQVFAKGSVSDYPLTLRHRDGKLVNVLYNATVYKDARGQVLGVFAAARDVTAQKQASQYARSLLEASLDPLVTISPDGKITDVNEATVKVTGVPRNELVGTDFTPYFTEPDKAREGYERAFSQGFVTDYPLTIRHRDDRLTDVLYNATVYKDSQGQVLGIFAAARDITQQKKTGEERSRLAAIVDSSRDAIIGKTLDGIITSWNKGAEIMFGYSANEIRGKHVRMLIPKELHEEEQRILEKIGRGERVEPYETRRLRKGGEVFDVSLTVSPVQDAEGRVVGASKIARDITAQKRSAQYARSLIEASLDPLVTISAGGKVTDVNEATVRATGIPRDALIGTDFSEYFTEPDKAREGYERVFSEGYVTDYPLTIRHKGGKLTHVLYNASVYRDPAGQVLGVFAAARDVTTQKQASEYARSLIEASLDPLVTISPDGKITDVNKATIQATGLPRERLIGTDFADYFTSPESARDGYKRVFSEGFVADYPLTIRHASGKVTPVLYNATVYKDVAGNVLGVFAAARDVTAQKRAEAELADQRSRELVRLAELEKFQRLTVGRELKMIELKKELADLARKTGATPEGTSGDARV